MTEYVYDLDGVERGRICRVGRLWYWEHYTRFSFRWGYHMTRDMALSSAGLAL